MSTSVVPLPERGILEIRGPDSQKFLQGQCTADVIKLLPGHATLGGFCTPKGRLYANFYLLCLADNHYWLVMPRAQVSSTQTRLQKYAAFFKTTLQDLSLQWHCLATLGEGEAEDLNWPASVQGNSNRMELQLTDQATLHWLNAEAETPYEQQLAQWEAQYPFQTEAAWARREIAWGVVWVLPETVEEYLPQVIAWDQIGGVSFTKGCYTGQEVVARLHYKGASKKLLRHVTGPGNAPEPLTAITDEGGKPLGHIARAVAMQDRWSGLAVMNTASDTLHQATVHENLVDLDAWVNYQPAVKED